MVGDIVMALPVSPTRDRLGDLDGMESPSFDGGSPPAVAGSSSPEETAEVPLEQGPLSAAPSTSVGIATEALLPPVDTTTTPTTTTGPVYYDLASNTSASEREINSSLPIGELRAKFDARFPGFHDAIVGQPVVSQERQAPPPKAPPPYQGPPISPDAVPDVAAETPGP